MKYTDNQSKSKSFDVVRFSDLPEAHQVHVSEALVEAIEQVEGWRQIRASDHPTDPTARESGRGRGS